VEGRGREKKEKAPTDERRESRVCKCFCFNHRRADKRCASQWQTTLLSFQPHCIVPGVCFADQTLRGVPLAKEKARNGSVRQLRMEKGGGRKRRASGWLFPPKTRNTKQASMIHLCGNSGKGYQSQTTPYIAILI